MPVELTLVTTPDEDKIQRALTDSRTSWNYYRQIFEHAGDIGSNPLLMESARFAAFCNKWAVARTINAGMRDQLRCMMRDSSEFADALDDLSGRALDQLHKDQLQPAFGTEGGKRKIISVVSKVATFLRPERFTAWDKYACAGLNLVIGRNKTASFESYADYLARFEEAWKGPHGQRIREATQSSTERLHSELRFQRRVLDRYLMFQGGYQ